MALSGVNGDGSPISIQQKNSKANVRKGSPISKRLSIQNASSDVANDEIMKRVYAPFSSQISTEEALQNCIDRLLVMRTYALSNTTENEAERIDYQQRIAILSHVQEVGKNLNLREFYKAVSGPLQSYSDEIYVLKSNYSKTTRWEALIDLLDELDSFRQSQEHKVTSAIRSSFLFRYGPTFIKNLSSKNTKTHAIVVAFREGSSSMETLIDKMEALICRDQCKELTNMPIDGIGKLKYAITLHLKSATESDKNDGEDRTRGQDIDQNKLVGEAKKIAEDTLKDHIYRIKRSSSGSALTFTNWLKELPLRQTGWRSDEFKKLLVDMGALKATRVDVFKRIHQVRTDSISLIGSRERWLQEIPLKEINWSEKEFTDLLLEMNMDHTTHN